MCWASQGAQWVKNPFAMQEKSRRHGFNPWKGKIPAPPPAAPPEESMATHSNILARESHGQKTPARYMGS